LRLWLGGLPRRPRSILVVITIFAYALLAGAAPSILRAALMAAAVIVARETGRRGQASSALGLTVIALLLLDPTTVTDVGFQLSAVATAGLLAWATPLHDWLATRLPRRNARLAARGARGLAGCAGVDAADRHPRIRPAVASLRRSPTCSSRRSSRRRCS